MKRVLIIILLVVAIILGYQLVTNGIQKNDGTALVSSYEEVEADSKSLSYSIANYNTLNSTQYNSMLTALSTSITKYQTAKEEYEKIMTEIGNTTTETTDEGEEIVYVSPISVYEIDFLWTIIGNYAKSEGLTMTMDISKSSVSVSNITGYEYYNLKFSVSGQYIDIAEFLYDIEDDDRLNFEIRDFSMTSGNATFTIYSVPIDSETLMNTASSTTTTDSTTTDGTTTTNTTDTNTVGNDTVTPNNTANTTNSTNTTNSINTTNTTNTTNSSNTTNNTAKN